MSAVYNIKSTPNGWQVNKFDDDFNLESSYEMTQSDGQTRCGCPAGARPTCRHRQMFPMLSLRVDSPWFLDFDTRQWVDPTGEAGPEGFSKSDSPLDPQGSLGSSLPATPIQKLHEPEPQQSVREPEGYVDRIAPTAQDSHPFRRRM